MLVQVSPSLVKRQKTHFHDLPCGASVILGNNGFIWIYPTPEQKDDEAGGYTTNLEVSVQGRYFFLDLVLGSQQGFSTCIISLCIHPFSSVLPQPVPLSDREVISRLRNCIMALVNHKMMLFDTSILYCYEASLPHQVQEPVVLIPH